MKKALLAIFTLTIFSSAIADVGLIMPDMTGQTGTQITVPVKVTNFQNIASVQGTIQFDPAIVTYSSVQNFGLPGMNATNFGYSQTGSGKLTFSWFDGTGGASLADSSVIFSITFNIVGTSAQVSNLSFVNSPAAIEVIDNSFNTVPTTIDNGSITVSGATASGVTLFMDNASGMVGSQMNISMKAVDFNDIAAIQGTIQFDPTALTFSTVNYFGLPGMNISSFNISQAASGKITFSWLDMSGSGTGVDMADSTALFTLQFTHSCTAGTSSVDIVNSPTPVEVDDATFNVLPTTLVSGSVSATPLTVSAMASTPTICEGTSTTITASGNAASYAWLPTDSLSAATGASVTADPSQTTTYTVTGTSAGCTATSSVTVTVDPLPDASFTATDNGDGTFTFTSNSTNSTSIGWDFGDGTFGTTSPVTHTYSVNATYPVILLAANSCGNDTMLMNVTEAAIGLKAVTGNVAVAVYPNPNKGMFTLKYDAAADKFSVQVVNALGATVLGKECTDTAEHLIPFDLSALESGIYHLQVNDQNQVLNTRIILNK
jgi:hypothetical protein